MTGTNLQALIEQARQPSSCAEIVVVISNKPGVQGLKRASLAGIQTRVNHKPIECRPSKNVYFDTDVLGPSQVVDHKLYGSRVEFDSTVDGVLEEFGVELVCLAGFMRILTGTFVSKWNGMKWPEYTGKNDNAGLYKTLNVFFLSHRKATEHSSFPPTIIQGCKCPETGSAGWGACCRLHSPLCSRKYLSSHLV